MKKDKIITIRVNEKEKKKLIEKSKIAKLSLSEYLIKQGLDKDIARKIKFTVAPKTCEDGKSILLVNIRNLSFDEIFETLMSLFYFVKETADKYKNK